MNEAADCVVSENRAGIRVNSDGLYKAARSFEKAAVAWKGLTEAILPKEIPLLAQAKEILDKDHYLFVSKGMDAQGERKELWKEYRDLKDKVEKDNLLRYETTTKAHFETLSERISGVAEIEAEAVGQLDV